MKKELLKTALTKMSDWTFFLILVIYQILFIFQGLDFADEGFYATFYQQIFNDPQSVAFDFMYWLSGILGGTFYYLFPESGLLGIRILGVIIVTLTIITVYHTLKKYLNIGYLRLGVLILVLFISNDPKEMYYNNLAALLFILSAIFLFYGLKDNKLIKIFYSGAFISLNMFARIPSVFGLIFFLGILFYGFINLSKVKYQIKQVITFFVGFIVMTIAILLIMMIIGHYSIFVENLKVVLGMGTSVDSSNNILRLIKLFIDDYSKSLIYGFLSVIFIIGFNSVTNSLFLSTKFNFKNITKIIEFIFLMLLIYLTINQTIKWIFVLWIFTGLSMIISILILTMNYNKDIKLLVFLGCLILLIAPFGSGGGLFGPGRYSLWLIFPIIIDFIFNIKTINSKSFIISNSHEYLFNIYISEVQLKRIKKYSVGLSIFICLYYSYYFPYFDRSERSRMIYPVENKFVKSIFTTKERASTINELLGESIKYVKKNDYVLAYDCIPMFHFLTETRPYMSNSWPKFYYPEAFKQELNKSLVRSKELPVVILQKMSTLDTDWPSEYVSEYKKTASDYMRDSILNVFLTKYDYKKVWENSTFEIHVSAKQVK